MNNFFLSLLLICISFSAGAGGRTGTGVDPIPAFLRNTVAQMIDLLSNFNEAANDPDSPLVSAMHDSCAEVVTGEGLSADDCLASVRSSTQEILTMVVEQEEIESVTLRVWNTYEVVEDDELPSGRQGGSHLSIEDERGMLVEVDMRIEEGLAGPIWFDKSELEKITSPAVMLEVVYRAVNILAHRRLGSASQPSPVLAKAIANFAQTEGFVKTAFVLIDEFVCAAEGSSPKDSDDELASEFDISEFGDSSKLSRREFSLNHNGYRIYESLIGQRDPANGFRIYDNINERSFFLSLAIHEEFGCADLSDSDKEESKLASGRWTEAKLFERLDEDKVEESGTLRVNFRNPICEEEDDEPIVFSFEESGVSISCKYVDSSLR